MPPDQRLTSSAASLSAPAPQIASASSATARAALRSLIGRKGLATLKLEACGLVQSVGAAKKTARTPYL